MTKPFLLVCAALISMAAGKTGLPVNELQTLDNSIESLMNQWRLPGAALAVVKDDKLVYARGFGLADVDNNRPVQPDSLFRIGSLSKSITATAVLQLVEAGRLNLDTPVLQILSPVLAPPELVVDARWRRITVRHLLYHSGGWDLRQTFDPMFLSADQIREAGGSFPLGLDQIVAFMLTQPLQFDPGTKYAYSNFGYSLLGAVIEQAAGIPYERYVRQHVLAAAGVTRMRLGGGPVTTRVLGEVEYHDYPGAPTGEAVYPGVGNQVPRPNGTVFMEPLAAAGGWIASAPDLARFAALLNNSEAILQHASLEQMLTRPAFQAASEPIHAGMGWRVMRIGQDYILENRGQAPGTCAYIAWFNARKTGVVALFNSSPPDEQEDALFDGLFANLVGVFAGITVWPTRDLSATYSPEGRPRIADSGVANAASHLGPEVAPGEVISLFGANLGPDEPAYAANGSAGPALAGSSVFFNGVPVPVFYASSERVDVAVPAGLTAGAPASVAAEFRGQRSNPVTVPVGASAPGLYTVHRNGRGYAAALNQDGTANGETSPAVKGAILALWATGVGPLDPSAQDGSISTDQIHVLLGDAAAEVVYAGPAPFMTTGIWQINIRVPMGAPSGMAPVRIEVNGQSGRNNVYVQIR